MRYVRGAVTAAILLAGLVAVLAHTRLRILALPDVPLNGRCSVAGPKEN